MMLHIYITLLFRFQILDRPLNAIRAPWTINIAAIRLEVNLSHKLMAYHHYYSGLKGEKITHKPRQLNINSLSNFLTTLF